MRVKCTNCNKNQEQDLVLHMLLALDYWRCDECGAGNKIEINEDNFKSFF